MSNWRQRAARWLKLLAVFFVGQSLVQAIGLVTGFLLLRWLSVEAYAQFTVAFGFQTTAAMIANLGLSGAIVALAGAQGTDPHVLGRYVVAAKYYRRIALSIILPTVVMLFPWIVAKQGWAWPVQIALLGSILCSIVAQGYVSLYSAPLLVHHKLRQSYTVQAGTAGLRLSLNSLLYAVAGLTGSTASWAATAVTILNAILFRRETGCLVREPPCSDAKTRREIITYLSPQLPGLIFTAFQGQIALLLVSIFGRAQSIAEVGALGRLGQILLILSAFNGVVLGPYFAKLPRVLLVRRYFQTLSVAVAISALIAIVAFAWPEGALWILGPAYAHLGREVSWSILSWGVGYTATVMWTMHTARKWVFWWVSAAYIPCIVLVQSVGASLLDLSTTMNMVFFSLIVAVATLLLHMVTAVCGFVCEARKMESEGS